MLSAGPNEDGGVIQPKRPELGALQLHTSLSIHSSVGLKEASYIVHTNCSSGAQHNFHQPAFIFSGRIHSEQEIKEMPRACSEQWQWVWLPTGSAEMHRTEMVHHKRAV